jgi:hypothetical protein
MGKDTAEIPPAASEVPLLQSREISGLLTQIPQSKPDGILQQFEACEDDLSRLEAVSSKIATAATAAISNEAGAYLDPVTRRIHDIYIRLNLWACDVRWHTLSSDERCALKETMLYKVLENSFSRIRNDVNENVQAFARIWDRCQGARTHEYVPFFALCTASSSCKT